MAFTKKLTAWVLTAAITAAMLPPLALPALAAGSGSGSINDNIDDQTLKTLGFNTDTKDINTVIKSDYSPLGDETVSVLTIDELVLHDGAFRQYDSADITGPGTVVGTQPDSNPYTGESDRIRTVAFNPLGGSEPRDTYIAEVTCKRSDDYSSFYLTVYGPNGAKLCQKYMGYNELPADRLQAPQAGAWLSIVAGDYDGDGRDELAVYDPTTQSDNYTHTPAVDIYRFDAAASGEKMLTRLDRRYIGGIYRNDKGSIISAKEPTETLAHSLNFLTSSRDHTDEDEGGARDHVNHFPSVSLATVEGTMDGIDDLAVAVSVSRSADDRDYADAYGYREDALQGKKWDNASLDVWINPLDQTTSAIQHVSSLSDEWGQYGTSGNRAERMLFPGVTSGDIDGDGLPELVVAGYRLKNPRIEGNDAGDWTLDEGRFLINYFDYGIAVKTDDEGKPVTNSDGTNQLVRSYKAAGLMQWVSMDPAEYNGQIHMNDAVGANQNDSDDQNMLEPMRLTTFAEYGASEGNYIIPQSVFVNGFVVSLPTVDHLSGISTGFEALPDDMSPYSSTNTFSVFNIKYAFPLEFVDDNRYGFVASSDKKVITDVVAGNFNGNPEGREQVVFTYLLQQGSTHSDLFSTVMCALDVDGDGLPVNKPIDERSQSASADAEKYFVGAKVYFKQVGEGGKDNKYVHYAISAPDWDDDSMLLRPVQGKKPDFFFSDPKIIAILEAAPYFGDVDYDKEPETSITAKSGSGESNSNGVSVSAYFNIGGTISVQASAGLFANIGMDVFSYESTLGLQGGGGYEHTTEVMNTISTTFSNKKYHTVVLNMTPYIRYYYQVWDPDIRQWEDMNVDVPRAPQLTQMAVTAYDDIAGPLGYPTIGDRILGGTKEGDPSTYSAQTPNKTWSAVTTGGKDDFATLGFAGGARTQALERELTWSDAGTWTAGGTYDNSLAVLVVKVNYGASVDYFGSHTEVAMKGNEYSGTVPDVGPGEAVTHTFDWQFGTWLVDVNDPTNTDITLGDEGLVSLDPDENNVVPAAVVLGYRVQNCSAPPNPPTDLTVTGVSSDSVTLEWRPVKTNMEIAGYELAQLTDEGEPYILGRFRSTSGGLTMKSFSHTDSGLTPGQTYRYVVRTIGRRAGGVEQAGPWSEPVSAKTPGPSDPQLLSHPQDATTLVGRDAVFSVEVEHSNTPHYQWLRRLPRETTWTDLDTDSSSYTERDAKLELDGARYRCIVKDRIGGSVVTMYSESAVLRVVEPAPTKTVSVAAAEGNDALIEGTAGEARFEVTTSAIPADTEIVLAGGGNDGISMEPAFTAESGVTEIAIRTTDETPAGRYSLRVNVGGIGSNAFALLVDVPAEVHGVTVVPDAVTVQKDGTQQFYALVDSAGSADTGVDWSVSGPEGGSLASATEIDADGLLTVASDEAAGELTVTAVSQFDDTVQGTATVTVLEDGETPEEQVLSLSISPKTAVLGRGEEQQFTAIVSVQGGADTTVYWSVEGGTDATITDDGLLEIGENETDERLTVTAVSPSGLSDSAQVTLIPEEPEPAVLSVTVTPGIKEEALRGTKVQFTAEVEAQGGADKTVTWSVSGGQNAKTTITQAGELTIGADETAGRLTVTALSNLDPDIRGTAVVTVAGPVDFSRLYLALQKAAGPLFGETYRGWYTQASLIVLQSAYTAGQDVYYRDDATQAEVDEATEVILRAYDELWRVYTVKVPFSAYSGSGVRYAQIEAPKDKFIRLLRGGEDDLVTISPSDYTVGTAGTDSMSLTLKEQFLDTLPVGDHTIHAEYSDGGAVLSLKVTVSGIVLVDGITVTGGDAITTRGGTLQLTATVTPDNAANQEVTWSVASGAAYASVDQNGLVTAKDDGTAVIRATAQDGSGVHGERSIAISRQSGGGSSSSSGGSKTPPKDKDNTVIDDKAGDKLVEDAVKNGKDTIDIEAKTPQVSLPSGLLADAGSKTDADIVISTPVASIRLPNGALGGLASLGGQITVQATLEAAGSDGHLLTLDITADGKTIQRVQGGVTVTVPYADGGVNTVAILQDGGKLLPKSFAQRGQMTVPLDGPAKARLTDNPKELPDTDGHWGKEYIDFVTSHGLFQGTDSGLFEADAPMTRGMLWTVLARMEGADTASTSGAWYAKGMDWAMQSGISDGSDPEGDITREQLAAMLWRVAGSPAVSSGAPDFPDADRAGSYARDALAWAVEQGILTGKGDGSLDPLGRATRAEVSAMLMRSIIHS